MFVQMTGEVGREGSLSPIGAGVFVAVVGPSGAGKDSVIGHAMTAFRSDPRVVLVRRVITRPSDPDAEDHDTMEEQDFADAEAGGAFALSWSAHGLRYGIPAEVDGVVADGRLAIANLSRNAIPALRDRYRNVIIAEITARPEILADRLAARGRESRGEVLARLARHASLDITPGDVVRIDNSGELIVAADRFAALLRSALGRIAG